jgi:3-hydroxyacyl-CoA dehydrogenase
MIFDLCTIDWSAISSIITGLMTIATLFAVVVSIRANKQAKIANRIAKDALDELVLQRKIQKEKDDAAEARWKAEKRFEMKFLKSEGISAEDIYMEEFPEIEEVKDNG